MNRLFTAVAVQSAFAAAFIAAAPLAAADAANDPLANASKTTIANRADVRREAIEARDERLRHPVNADAQPEPAAPAGTLSRTQVRAEAIEARDERLRHPVNADAQPEPAAPAGTLSRTQVRAEAIEANRLGLTSSYEDKTRATPEQLTQIQRAGERAAGNMQVAAARR
jgi:hypothetical protein